MVIIMTFTAVFDDFDDDHKDDDVNYVCDNDFSSNDDRNEEDDGYYYESNESRYICAFSEQLLKLFCKTGIC